MLGQGSGPTPRWPTVGGGGWGWLLVETVHPAARPCLALLPQVCASFPPTSRE